MHGPNRRSQLPATNLIFKIPLEPVDTFVERRELSRHIERKLGSATLLRSPKCIIPIHGLGGIGKTQMALTYATRIRETYQVIYWIDATSMESIKADSTRLHGQIEKASNRTSEARSNDPDIRETIDLLTYTFTSWLLIFDNADFVDLRMICNWFASTDDGHVLITTRKNAKDLVKGCDVEVDVMSLEEGRDVFLRNANIARPSTRDEELIDIITELLGRFPLALELAGAYIRDQPYYTDHLDEYWQQLDARKQQILQHTPDEYLKDYHFSVLTTWESAFEALEKKCINATRILTLFGWLDRMSLDPRLFIMFAFSSNGGKDCGFQVEMVHQAFEKGTFESNASQENVGEGYRWNPFHYEKAITELRSYHLVKLGSVGQMVEMHPLVHQWALERLTLLDQQSWFQITLVMLATMASLGGAYHYSAVLARNIDHFTKKFPKFVNGISDSEEFKLKSMSEHLTMGSIQQMQWWSALRLIPHLKERTKRGEVQALNLQVLYTLNSSVGGTPSEALKIVDLARTALIETQQELPEDKEEILEAKWHLGNVLTHSCNADHRTEAESILEESVGEASSLYGDTARMTLIIRRVYSACLVYQQKYDEAIAGHEEILSALISDGEADAIDLSISKVQIADAIILKVQNQLAQDLLPYHFQQLERADTLLAEALQDRMRLFGPDNISVGKTRFSIRHLREQQERVLDSPGGRSLRFHAPGTFMGRLSSSRSCPNIISSSS